MRHEPDMSVAVLLADCICGTPSRFDGAGDAIRTRDILLGKEMLYH
jgi:hypothetical protein